MDVAEQLAPQAGAVPCTGGTPVAADGRARLKGFVRELAGLAAMLAAAVVVLHALGVTCLVKALTGVSCPGCGLTRAWLAALSLDLASAVAYHPLFWAAPVAAVAAIAESWTRGAARRVAHAVALVALVGLVAVWVVRLLSPADAALLLGDAVPAGVPTDIVGVSSPVWLEWLSSL